MRKFTNESNTVSFSSSVIVLGDPLQLDGDFVQTVHEADDHVVHYQSGSLVLTETPDGSFVLKFPAVHAAFSGTYREVLKWAGKTFESDTKKRVVVGVNTMTLSAPDTSEIQLTYRTTLRGLVCRVDELTFLFTIEEGLYCRECIAFNSGRADIDCFTDEYHVTEHSASA